MLIMLCFRGRTTHRRTPLSTPSASHSTRTSSSTLCTGSRGALSAAPLSIRSTCMLHVPWRVLYTYIPHSGCCHVAHSPLHAACALLRACSRYVAPASPFHCIGVVPLSRPRLLLRLPRLLTEEQLASCWRRQGDQPGIGCRLANRSRIPLKPVGPTRRCVPQPARPMDLRSH